jgi:hypothetical protein
MTALSEPAALVNKLLIPGLSHLSRRQTQHTSHMASAGVLTQRCNTRGSARPLKHALLFCVVSCNEGQGCVGNATCELSADSAWDAHLNMSISSHAWFLSTFAFLPTVYSLHNSCSRIEKTPLWFNAYANISLYSVSTARSFRSLVLWPGWIIES